MWSLYVGRPESIDHLDITVQHPDQVCYRQNVNSKWTLYTDENQQTPTWESPAYFDEVAQATVALCTKMASIRKVM